MGLDRMQRDEQLFGDLLIRATLSNQPQYRQLAIAQHGLVTRAWRIVRITLELQQSFTQAFALGDRKNLRQPLRLTLLQLEKWLGQLLTRRLDECLAQLLFRFGMSPALLQGFGQGEAAFAGQAQPLRTQVLLDQRLQRANRLGRPPRQQIHHGEVALHARKQFIETGRRQVRLVFIGFEHIDQRRTRFLQLSLVQPGQRRDQRQNAAEPRFGHMSPLSKPFRLP